jgi:thiamine-phosphate pyrophosphorylase
MNSALPQVGLYAITPDIADTEQLTARVRAALEGGVRILQYRNKRASNPLQTMQAREMRALCDTFSVPLIVNDDVELSLRVKADGVHLGESDGDAQQIANARAAGLLVGVSCYDSFARARWAVEHGASYVAFGAFYASQTKPNARQATLDLLDTAASLPVPSCAIGGITRENAPPLIEAGANYIAVISDLFDQNSLQDITSRAASFAGLWESRPRQ